MTSDPVSRLALAVALILAAAKIGGDLASRAKQPPVLGELLAGIVLGSLPWPFFAELRTDPYVDMLARIGVLVLLFEVGLDSTVRDVMKVGFAATRVAVLGTVGTIAAGWAAASLAMPHASGLVRLFLACAITATSIGITARVLKDAAVSRTKEAHTILSAAVLDDVLGLIVLAIISGAVAQSSSHGGVTPLGVGLLFVKTLGFLAAAVVVGVKVSPRLFAMSAHLKTPGTLVAVGLAFCFVLSWASDAMGLAPIVGAFTAGLILEELHSAPFVDRGERPLLERMEPISSWLVPIFFVLMGMRAEFRALARPEALLLVAALTAAAVVGKLACAVGAPRGTDRLAIAFGMVPRGEVSLVFANLGLSLRVNGAPLLDAAQYSALVTVVILTTLITPAALRARIERKRATGRTVALPQ